MFEHRKLDVKLGHLGHGSSRSDVKLREGSLTALAVSVIVPGLVSGVWSNKASGHRQRPLIVLHLHQPTRGLAALRHHGQGGRPAPAQGRV